MKKNINMIDFIKKNNEYFERIITQLTYNSNKIEGSTLSYAETYAILFNDNSFSLSNIKPREIYEAINHKYALNYILNLNEPLSEKAIIKIAVLLNKNIDEIDNYRKMQVFIQGAEHVPPKPENVPFLMQQFIDNYNHYPAITEKEIFYKTALFHIKFEKTHPFSDGNGRTGRLLINLEMLNNNLPIISIPGEKRIEYFNYIKNNDVEGLSLFLKLLSEKEEELLKEISR